MNKVKQQKKNENNGTRNLVLLGVLSTLIAVITTGFSLMIYHNSGDIYLDRSRPGYLPDEEEIEDENSKEEEDFTFEKSGKLTKENLDEFLENYNLEVESIDAYKKPFDESVLSDDRLGIPPESESKPEAET